MKIQIRNRYSKQCRDIGAQELVSNAIAHASSLRRGEIECMRAEQERLAELFGNLIDHLLTRDVIKLADLPTLIDDLGEWEIVVPDPVRRVTINGGVVEVLGFAMSYADIVRDAGLSGQPSMTWRSQIASGTLSPGGSISTDHGLVINVCHTDNT